MVLCNEERRAVLLESVKEFVLKYAHDATRGQAQRVRARKITNESAELVLRLLTEPAAPHKPRTGAAGRAEARARALRSVAEVQQWLHDVLTPLDAGVEDGVDEDEDGDEDGRRRAAEAACVARVLDVQRDDGAVGDNDGVDDDGAADDGVDDDAGVEDGVDEDEDGDEDGRRRAAEAACVARVLDVQRDDGAVGDDDGAVDDDGVADDGVDDDEDYHGVGPVPWAPGRPAPPLRSRQT